VLSITEKPCRTGTHLSARVEFKGDDKSTAIDFTLKEIMLESKELNAFLQDPHAHQRLFDTPHPGALFQPGMPMIAALPVREKIEGVFVEIVLTAETTLRLAKANLARISLERQVGGLTAMSCQVQCTPKLDSSIAQLLAKLDAEVEVTIGQEQAELDLSGAGEGDETETTGAAAEVEEEDA
jgi:hypothetical protein